MHTTFLWPKKQGLHNLHIGTWSWKTSLRCYLGLSVTHLIGATQDERWRQGHAFAAQHYLAHCGLLELASPITSYFWYLFAAVGRNCSHCSPPATPPCGHRLRQRMPRFLAMKPQRFAPFVHRSKPLSGILQGLTFWKYKGSLWIIQPSSRWFCKCGKGAVLSVICIHMLFSTAVYAGSKRHEIILVSLIPTSNDTLF